MKNKPPDLKTSILKQQGTLNPHPEKVNEPLFTQDDFFDPLDLLQVKYEMLRKVLIDKKSVTDASKSFGFSRLSFYKIRSAFEQQGLAVLFNKKRVPQGPYKLTDEVIQFIKQIYTIQPPPSVIKIKQQIETHFNFSIHKRTLERALVPIKKKRKKRKRNEKSK